MLRTCVLVLAVLSLVGCGGGPRPFTPAHSGSSSGTSSTGSGAALQVAGLEAGPPAVAPPALDPLAVAPPAARPRSPLARRSRHLNRCARFFQRRSLQSPPPQSSAVPRSFVETREAPGRAGSHPLPLEMHPGRNPDLRTPVEDEAGKDSRSQWEWRGRVDGPATGLAFGHESRTGCRHAAAAAPRVGPAN